MKSEFSNEAFWLGSAIQELASRVCRVTVRGTLVGLKMDRPQFSFLYFL